MEVKNVRWVGIHTQQYDRTVDFFGDVLGMQRHFEEPATVEFETTEGDEVQVMGPGHPYFQFFSRHATGPVPLFEVDDLVQARQRLVQARTEIVGPPDRDSHWEWLQFRAPDGHLYELACCHPGAVAPGGPRSFVGTDVNRHHGKIVGYDTFSGKFNIHTNKAFLRVALSRKGGLLFVHVTLGDHGPFTGKVTGGRGRFSGARGTVTGFSPKHSNKSFVRVRYHF